MATQQTCCWLLLGVFGAGSLCQQSPCMMLMCRQPIMTGLHASTMPPPFLPLLARCSAGIYYLSTVNTHGSARINPKTHCVALLCRSLMWGELTVASKTVTVK